MLPRIIPPERHPRQPLVDGCQRLLALGPFVARLPVDPELRIGRGAVRHNGAATQDLVEAAERGGIARRHETDANLIDVLRTIDLRQG